MQTNDIINGSLELTSALFCTINIFRIYKVIGILLIFISLLDIFKGMQVLMFLIGTFITFLCLSSKITTWIAKISLSMISAYGIFRLFFPNVYIWKISDYDEPSNYGRFFSSEYFGWSLFFALASFGIFYFLIRICFINFLINPLEKAHKKTINKIPEGYQRMLRAWVIKSFKRIIRKGRRKGIIRKGKENKQLTSNEFSEIIYNVSEFSIHIIVCWFALEFYSGTPIIISFSIISVLLLISIIAISGIDLFDGFIGKFIEHESTLIHKDIVK